MTQDINLHDRQENQERLSAEESEVVRLLESFSHFGVELGLERIDRLLSALGHPHQHVPIIHVAGSNGKGSVCAYLSTVLTEAGFRVGRYTSPHLVSWCERICLNDHAIAPVELQRILLKVIQAIDPAYSSPTQFEVITAAAWLYFARQQVDVAVMEVGLGGRLDATNVCDRPLVSVITSISKEHWQRLGPTVADIAGEKAGILKAGCPAVIGVLPAEAQSVVQQRIAQLNCQAEWVMPAQDLGNGWARYDYALNSVSQQASIQYPLALLGQHQLMNSALAIATLQYLRAQNWLISEAAIVRGMAQTQWAGRLQWITWDDHSILIDGAHNPAAAETLRMFIDQTLPPGGSIHWVMGMLSTKDHDDIFRALLRRGDRLYLAPVPDHSSASPDDLATLAHNLCPELASYNTYDNLFAALQKSTKLATHQPNNIVVLCGSLYLIGYFLKTTRDRASAFDAGGGDLPH